MNNDSTTSSCWKKNSGKPQETTAASSCASPQVNAPVFVTTRWTQVLQAQGESEEAGAALSELCQAYYQPVLGFIRHSGRPEDAARDLTQEFFARLLARHGLATVQRGCGRFRSFLLGAVKHFLADQHDHDRAAKRGGGLPPLSIDHTTETTAALPIPDPIEPPSDAYFDRQWALTVVNRALKLLEDEQRNLGKHAQFETLKSWLGGDAETLSQAEAARVLNTTEGAVKVIIHRLRRRFRELVKSEITHTVDEPAQVQDELRYLLEVLTENH